MGKSGTPYFSHCWDEEHRHLSYPWPVPESPDSSKASQGSLPTTLYQKEPEEGNNLEKTSDILIINALLEITWILEGRGIMTAPAYSALKNLVFLERNFVLWRVQRWFLFTFRLVISQEGAAGLVKCEARVSLPLPSSHVYVCLRWSSHAAAYGSLWAIHLPRFPLPHDPLCSVLNAGTSLAVPMAVHRLLLCFIRLPQSLTLGLVPKLLQYQHAIFFAPCLLFGFSLASYVSLSLRTVCQGSYG